MTKLILLLAAMGQGATEAVPARQWQAVAGVPGWQAYGWINKNGYVIAEKFRRADNPAVEVAPVHTVAEQLAMERGTYVPRPGAAAVASAVVAAPAPYDPPPVSGVIPQLDPYGFTNWLNNTRAAYGLPAVGYDPNLESWASQNNAQQAAYGMGHFVMGPARRQNAAVGGFPGIESMWMASGGHRAALLDPTIRWIGIAAYGAYWTFNAY
jgi:uncharacterized protein YkwD